MTLVGKKFSGIGKISGFIVLLFLSACTRPEADKSTVDIAIPSTLTNQKVGTLGATSVLGHVVINVTGAGIAQPIVYQWDSHCDGCATPPPPPASFSLDVPSGTDRLIQVLAVYQDSTNQAMNFYYGDVTQSLASSTEAVSVGVASLGGGVQTISGRIAGRYFTSANTGPTGEVSINFNPGAGRQKMVIERSKIVNGWFEFFALDSVDFEYQLVSTGEILFGGPVNINSAIFDPNYTPDAGASYPEWNRRVKMAMPLGIRYDTGNSSYKPEEAGYFVWGFWGNSAAMADASWTSRYVSKDTSGMSGTLTNMKKYDVSPANWPSTPTLNVTNLINGGLTLPSKTDLLNQASPFGYVTFLGGISSSCIGTPLYDTCLSVSKTLVDGNGNDHMAGFSVPFRFSSGQPFSVDNGDPRTVTGQLLPGILSGELILFKKVGVSNNEHIDDPDCYEAQSGITGWVNAGSASADGLGNFTMTSNITATEATTGTAGIICNSLAGVMARHGTYLSSYYFSGGGGTPPLISSDINFSFGNVTTPSGTMDHTFTLTNTSPVMFTAMGGLTLTPPFSFKGGAFPGAGGTCTSSLSPSSSCLVVVTFAPTTINTYSATMQINYNDGSTKNLMVPISGNGI